MKEIVCREVAPGHFAPAPKPQKRKRERPTVDAGELLKGVLVVGFLAVCFAVIVTAHFTPLWLAH